MEILTKFLSRLRGKQLNPPHRLSLCLSACLAWSALTGGTSWAVLQGNVKQALATRQPGTTSQCGDSDMSRKLGQLGQSMGNSF